MRAPAQDLKPWDDVTEARLRRLEADGRGVFDAARLALAHRTFDPTQVPMYCYLLSDAYRFQRAHRTLEEVERDSVVSGPQCLRVSWDGRKLSAEPVMFPLVTGNMVVQYLVTAKADDRMLLVACDRLESVAPKGGDISVAWGADGIFTL
jgi:hypothetical protein